MAYRVRKRTPATVTDSASRPAPRWADGPLPVISTAVATLADLQGRIVQLAHALEGQELALRRGQQADRAAREAKTTQQVEEAEKRLRETSSEAETLHRTATELQARLAAAEERVQQLVTALEQEQRLKAAASQEYQAALDSLQLKLDALGQEERAQRAAAAASKDTASILAAKCRKSEQEVNLQRSQHATAEQTWNAGLNQWREATQRWAEACRQRDARIVSLEKSVTTLKVELENEQQARRLALDEEAEARKLLRADGTRFRELSGQLTQTQAQQKLAVAAEADTRRRLKSADEKILALTASLKKTQEQQNLGLSAEANLRTLFGAEQAKVITLIADLAKEREALKRAVAGEMEVRGLLSAAEKKLVALQPAPSPPKAPQLPAHSASLVPRQSTALAATPMSQLLSAAGAPATSLPHASNPLEGLADKSVERLIWLSQNGKLKSGWNIEGHRWECTLAARILAHCALEEFFTSAGPIEETRSMEVLVERLHAILKDHRSQVPPMFQQWLDSNAEAIQWLASSAHFRLGGQFASSLPWSRVAERPDVKALVVRSEEAEKQVRALAVAKEKSESLLHAASSERAHLDKQLTEAHTEIKQLQKARDRKEAPPVAASKPGVPPVQGTVGLEVPTTPLQKLPPAPRPNVAPPAPAPQPDAHTRTRWLEDAQRSVETAMVKQAPSARTQIETWFLENRPILSRLAEAIVKKKTGTPSIPSSDEGLSRDVLSHLRTTILAQEPEQAPQRGAWFDANEHMLLLMARAILVQMKSAPVSAPPAKTQIAPPPVLRAAPPDAAAVARITAQVLESMERAMVTKLPTKREMLTRWFANNRPLLNLLCGCVARDVSGSMGDSSPDDVQALLSRLKRAMIQPHPEQAAVVTTWFEENREILTATARKMAKAVRMAASRR